MKTERSVFSLIPKKGNAKECSNYRTIVLISNTSKVMSLLLNMLSRLDITFLPRSKRLLISWLQSPSAVILEPEKIKFDTVSPSISHEVMGPDAMIFFFWMLSFKPTFWLSTVYCDPHSQRLWHSQQSRNRCFSGTLLLFPWSSGCWQFGLWFLCLF